MRPAAEAGCETEASDDHLDLEAGAPHRAERPTDAQVLAVMPKRWRFPDMTSLATN
jgi:hypothetical protein